VSNIKNRVILFKSGKIHHHTNIYQTCRDLYSLFNERKKTRYKMRIIGESERYEKIMVQFKYLNESQLQKKTNSMTIVHNMYKIR